MYWCTSGVGLQVLPFIDDSHMGSIHWFRDFLVLYGGVNSFFNTYIYYIVFYSLVRLFDLEARVNGQCVDFVNVHDGASTADVTLNASPLCHGDAEGNITSTSNKMTIYFETDATGARHGFDFIFVAITTGRVP